MNIYGLRSKAKRLLGIIAVILAVMLATVIVVEKTDVVPRMSRIFVPLSSEDDHISFLDVGQGDCALVHSNGKNVLIDTGTPDSAEALCGKLSAFLEDRIDAVIITHYHMDHVGGLGALSERYYIDNLLLPTMGEEQEGTGAAKTAVSVVEGAGGGVYTVVEGMTVEVGDFEITVLQYAYELEDENDRSLVLMAEIRGKRFLFTSDIERAGESVLMDSGLDIKCDVIKIAHHGSATSTTKRLIEACAPEHAVISCGRNNNFGHPHDDTLALLDMKKINICRTDMSGDITVFVEDDKLKVKKEK